MNKPLKLTAAAALLAASAGAVAAQADNAWIDRDIASLPQYTLVIVNNHPVLARDPVAFFTAEPAPVPMAAANDTTYLVVPGVTTETTYLLSEPAYYIAGPVTGATNSVGQPVTP